MSKRHHGMTPAQRAKFFGTWWPDCCEAQGWEDKSEKLRREFVLEATTALRRDVPSAPTPTERLSLCTQGQLSAVFKLAWFKTKNAGASADLNSAIDSANPAEANERDEQRRAVVALSDKGLTQAEIARVLTPICRKHGVGDWQRLPSKALKEVMHWKQFQPAEIARRRNTVLSMPLGVVSDTVVEYQMKPFKKFTPAVRETAENPY